MAHNVWETVYSHWAETICLELVGLVTLVVLVACIQKQLQIEKCAMLIGRERQGLFANILLLLPPLSKPSSYSKREGERVVPLTTRLPRC